MPRPAEPPHRAASTPLDLESARRAWPDLIKELGANLKWRIVGVEPVEVVGPDVLVIAGKPGYNDLADACGTPEALEEIGRGLQRLIHRPVSVRYVPSQEDAPAVPEARPSAASRPDSLMADPMVQKVVELFDARSLHLEYDDPDSAPRA
jgi:hypothetical protein